MKHWTAVKCTLLLILAAMAGVWVTLIALVFYATVWILDKFFS